MKCQFETRLAGTKHQYFILRILDSQGNIVKVHTGKKLSYLQKIAKGYKK